MKTEFGRYLVIFAALLSPEIIWGRGGLAGGRRIVVHDERTLRSGVASFHTLRDPDERGPALAARSAGAPPAPRASWPRRVA